MPFIETKTNVALSAEKEAALRRKLGAAIALLPGKNEKWLMLNFEDNCRMAFRGVADTKIALVRVNLFGGAPKEAYDRLTAEICRIMTEEVGIPGDSVYVQYQETDTWGFDGENF